MTSHQDSLSAQDFNQLCRLIYGEVGISLGVEKKVMLEGRLRRRMAKLSKGTFGEYCDFIFSQRSEEEMVHLIDAVTTNKTDFFREESHFEYLISKVIPELTNGGSRTEEFLVWSAGCSSGEEPYTLAMVLSEYAKAHPRFRFRVLATDISTDMLDKAQQGIFTTEVAAAIPQYLQRKYLMRSRDPESKRVRVVPEIRELIEFRRLNFMDDFELSGRANVIFCRNVMIYFDRSTQERLLWKLSGQLEDNGYMFVGHSENLHKMDIPLEPVNAAVYRKCEMVGNAELRQMYLQPGQAHFARTPTIIKTILGSCVGVTFWNKRRGIGALCHGVLPTAPKSVMPPEGFRFVDFSIRELTRQMEKFGICRSEIQVKVFGGADVLPVDARIPDKKTVGLQNWQTAISVLQEEHLKVTATDLGGVVGRTIQFNSSTGEILLRKLEARAKHP